MTTPQIVIELDGGASGHYRLTVVAEWSPEQSAKRPYEFTVRATHIASGRTSVVNQLNFCLSWFNGADHFEDWPWVASWDKVRRWLRDALELAAPNALPECSTSNWGDLEAALDEDRAEGEWANSDATLRADFAAQCRTIATVLYNAAVSGRETWLTTRELLARVGQGRQHVQLGVSPVFFLGLNGDVVSLLDEERGDHDATLAAFLQEHEDLGTVWRWIEPVSPGSSADNAPIFPFCKDCAQNADGAPCHDCNAHVCNACARDKPNGDRVCDECYTRYLDPMACQSTPRLKRGNQGHAIVKELDWERANFDTPLAAQLDENLAEGIDY